MYRDLEERELSYRFNFCPGKENQAADAFSRAPIAHTSFDEGADMTTEARVASVFCSDSNVESIGETDKLEDLDMAAIRKEIVKDSEYIKLLQAVIKGDHPKLYDKSHPARQWLGVWQHLSVLESSGPIVYDGERVILPKGLQMSTIVELHKVTHGSCEKMINTLKKYYIWENYKKDIKRVYDTCEACIKFKPSNPEGKMRLDKIKLTDIAPMSILHCDLFAFGEKNFLSVRDQQSTLTWMFPLNSTTTDRVLRQLDSLQQTYGLCRKIVSDGGPQFRHEFAEYCERKRISHELSSAYSPTSNAYSEVGVKLCKYALRRASVTGQDPATLLNLYQDLTLSDCNSSPKELFMKRRLRTTLGLSLLILEKNKKYDWENEIRLREEARMSRQIRDQSSSPNQDFAVGDAVRIQSALKPHTWDQKGTILERVLFRDSYLVLLPSGREVIRHH